MERLHNHNLKYSCLQKQLTVEEKTYDPKAKWDDVSSEGMGDFHPVAWYHEFDSGRSFYTVLDHIGASYNNPLFLEHIYGSIFLAAAGKGTKE